MSCFRFCISKAVALLLLLFTFTCAAKIRAAELSCADGRLYIYQIVGTGFVALVGHQFVLEFYKAATCLFPPEGGFCVYSPVVFHRIYRGPPSQS